MAGLLEVDFRDFDMAERMSHVVKYINYNDVKTMPSFWQVVLYDVLRRYMSCDEITSQVTRVNRIIELLRRP